MALGAPEGRDPLKSLEVSLETGYSEDRMKEVGLKAFDHICDAWGLSFGGREKLLHSPSGRDVIERVSYVMGIYKALHILLPGASHADSWVHRPNAHFEGRPALSVMLDEPDGLRQVRRYLDAQLV